VLYLRGISSKDFEPALAEFFGSEAGLSASTIQRLTREWTAELAAFQQRDLSQVDCMQPKVKAALHDHERREQGSG
jgi:transposase-like protein